MKIFRIVTICFFCHLLVACVATHTVKIGNYNDMQYLKSELFNGNGVPLRAEHLGDYNEILINENNTLFVSFRHSNRLNVFNLKTNETIIEGESYSARNKLLENYREFKFDDKLFVDIAPCNRFSCGYNIETSTICTSSYNIFPHYYTWIECIDFSKDKEMIKTAIEQNDIASISAYSNRLPKQLWRHIVKNELIGKINNSGSNNFTEKVLSELGLHKEIDDEYGRKHNLQKPKAEEKYHIIKDFKQATISDCASDLNISCMKYRMDEGDDINESDPKTGIPPIYYAITKLRNMQTENYTSINAIKFLLENGADTKDKVNPYSLAIKRDLTPEEYLTVSVVEPLFNLRAPKAPKTLALFSNSEIMKKNTFALTIIKRAKELGIARNELIKKMSQLDNIRAKNSFESYFEAFLISRSKNDFIKAQKLANTSEQKMKLEYLAVMAVPDKAGIFNISIKMNNVTGNALSNKSREDKILYVFRFPQKTSDTRFEGRSEIKKATSSPLDLKYPYKVTVKYTLTVTRQTKTTVTFIITQTSMREEIDKREVTGTCELKPTGYTGSTKLDFGIVKVAGSMRALGGGTETTLKDNPEVTAEIIKVEML